MKNAAAQEKNSDEKLLQSAAAIDAFEGYPNPHSRRLAILSEAVARRFHLAPPDCLTLQQAALLHDVGELVMNRDYIRSHQDLNEEERGDLRRHPVIGEQEAAKRGFTRGVQLLIRWHHEWWNGAGYPDALKNEQIPLAARILRVVDTYCALTDARPFRAALSEAAAREYLTEWAGIEFDPQVVKHFLDLDRREELKSFQADDYVQ